MRCDRAVRWIVTREKLTGANYSSLRTGGGQADWVTSRDRPKNVIWEGTQVDTLGEGTVPQAFFARTTRMEAPSRGQITCLVMDWHQARHRHLTQPLLDLKRLYWNCRRFREGKRRRSCP